MELRLLPLLARLMAPYVNCIALGQVGRLRFGWRPTPLRHQLHLHNLHPIGGLGPLTETV